MNRGEVWEADIGDRIGKRPVVVLTRSAVIPYLSKVVVAEVISKGKGYPTQVAIGQHGNLPRHSFVATECLHTLPKERLHRYLGQLPPELIQRINRAVIFALDLTTTSL